MVVFVSLNRLSHEIDNNITWALFAWLCAERSNSSLLCIQTANTYAFFYRCIKFCRRDANYRPSIECIIFPSWIIVFYVVPVCVCWSKSSMRKRNKSTRTQIHNWTEETDRTHKTIRRRPYLCWKILCVKMFSTESIMKSNCKYDKTADYDYKCAILFLD